MDLHLAFSDLNFVIDLKWRYYINRICFNHKSHHLFTLNPLLNFWINFSIISMTSVYTIIARYYLLGRFKDDLEEGEMVVKMPLAESTVNTLPKNAGYSVENRK